MVSLALVGEGVLDQWVATSLCLTTEASAVLLCWAAASEVGFRRLEVTLAASAVTLYATGDVLYSYLSNGEPALAIASVADAGYLLFSVLVIGALGVVIHRQLRGRLWPVLLDSLVGTLAAASVISMVVAPTLNAVSLGSVTRESTIAIAYPVLDIVTIALIAGILASQGLDLGPRWPILLIGLGLFAAFDVGYALDPESYSAGSLYDAGWTAGVVAVAVWVDGIARPLSDRRRGNAGIPALAAPIISTVAALGVLVLASQKPVPVLAVVLSGLTLAAAAIPLSFRHRLQRTLARTDDLTGLTNRRALYADVPDRLQPGQHSALLLLDLDRFKDVNDGLGHDVGDGLLQRVGERLTEQVRSSDLISRIGGDEFAIFLADVSEEAAVETAARISRALEEPFTIGGVIVQTSASVGVALYPEHGPELGSLLRSADVAMYRAKADHSGHHLYQLDYNDHREIRFRTVQELRTAIAERQFVMHYQPKICPGGPEIADVESLVRWNHPTRGLLYPGSFLQLAEEAGLMPQLTDVIMDQVLDQAVRWRSEGLELAIAVNVSASCLRQDMPHRITRLLSARNLPPSVIVLEITEEILLQEGPQTAGILREIRARGIEISIDDFGTGYSSLAYLRDLPVDELKLDRSFIAPMNQDPRATNLVASIIDLAHSLGLRIVAEGVEDEEAYTALAGLNCDLIQGYYLSKPIPAGELSAWMARRRVAAGLV
ncbi:EAL domain-containing protein [Arthrobacter sp. 260]|uniref:putative bifunctional diguanylate cyclase/phosphodiesterase n=1 Tax=Arthrobacter sp. 260 TaxID=2735314 RepID=UPI001492DEED|nr:EAL domain-containing protein [Arthrobacter sp. 260]NOJ60098.1 EAL domain-containing protein [Arthrobacter sp. 260]